MPPQTTLAVTAPQRRALQLEVWQASQSVEVAAQALVDAVLVQPDTAETQATVHEAIATCRRAHAAWLDCLRDVCVRGDAFDAREREA